MAVISKTALGKILSGAVARLKELDAALVAAEEALGSVQLRQGMVLAQVKEALSSRDDSVSFKEWCEKNRKRPYGTLNRWSTAGATALALGLTDSDETVPPLYKIEPGYRFIRDAKTPEKFSEGVAQLEKWWTAVSESDAATAIAKAEKMRPSGSSKKKGSNGGNGGGNGSGDASETVTIDPAAVSAIAADIRRRNNRKAYAGIDHMTLNACRTETALLIRENAANPAYLIELLAALSS